MADEAYPYPDYDDEDEGSEPGSDLSRAPQLNIPGYEGTNFMEGNAVMPPKQQRPPHGDLPPLPNTDIAMLDEEACRDAIIQHVNKHCCYGSKPAKQMQMAKIEGVTALHLTLETFTEGRQTKNKHEPYKGGHVDGPKNGHTPAPWEVNVPPQELFKKHKIKREVPHSSVVKPCWECDHRGWRTCSRCDGKGRVRCNTCDGKGYKISNSYGARPRRVTCYGGCGGKGKERCSKCGGDGRTTCKECEGYKNLRCFVQITCKFRNHDDHVVLGTTDMPDKLVKKASGTVLLKDTQVSVRPIVSYPVAEINAESHRLVKDHDEKWPSERTRKQRQTLRGVPVTEIAYDWDDVNTRFWVYGNERRVYAPDYPHRCCCCCSVL